ncbi:MAG: hypothetical protein HOG49_36535, partial [Candidatus Scalindua sp.]|nr:hypothetical protein [Candidatus Scalindua sp.]
MYGAAEDFQAQVEIIKELRRTLRGIVRIVSHNSLKDNVLIEAIKMLVEKELKDTDSYGYG